jgi:hypothetical protein
MESAARSDVNLIAGVKNAMVMAAAQMNIPVLSQESEDTFPIDEPIEKLHRMKMGPMVHRQNDRSFVLCNQTSQFKLRLPYRSESAEEKRAALYTSVNWQDNALSEIGDAAHIAEDALEVVGSIMVPRQDRGSSRPIETEQSLEFRMLFELVMPREIARQKKMRGICDARLSEAIDETIRTDVAAVQVEIAEVTDPKRHVEPIIRSIAEKSPTFLSC